MAHEAHDVKAPVAESGGELTAADLKWLGRPPEPREPTMLCVRCGYVLDGLSEPRCPECGQAFDRRDPRTFRPAAREPFGRVWARTAWAFGLAVGLGALTFTWLPASLLVALVLLIASAIHFGKSERAWKGCARIGTALSGGLVAIPMILSIHEIVAGTPSSFGFFTIDPVRIGVTGVVVSSLCGLVCWPIATVACGSAMRSTRRPRS